MTFNNLGLIQPIIEALEEKVEGLIERKVNFSLAFKPNPNQKNILLYERH